MTHNNRSEYPSPAIFHSRRLMGPNLYSDNVGAVLEVQGDRPRLDDLITRWTKLVTQLRVALGWTNQELRIRHQPGGANLFIVAPVDLLMTATDVNELAWVLAELKGARVDDAALDSLRVKARAEAAAQGGLAAMYAAANERGLIATFDDDALTIGSGAGNITWPVDAIPSVESVEWNCVRDVPIALVAGSNGKTTTARLIAAMWRGAGYGVGWNCSDGVWVTDEQVEVGDYAGPAGARTVLRDKRVHAAVLETARGGMLRRGLAVNRADVAIITNISADHFGEYGMETLDDLTEAKSIVARVLGDQGTLVLNADDNKLCGLAERSESRIAMFSASAGCATLMKHLARGGDVATIRDGHAWICIDHEWDDLGAIDEMPITLGGGAQHNVMNLLGASLAGALLGISPAVIRETLAAFGASRSDNPGRLQVFEIGGVTAVIDYAHNPGGLATLCATASMFPARRRALVLGQAGDREDDQLRALVHVALTAMTFDHIVVKEMPELFRGRESGEVSHIVLNELRQGGFAIDRTEVAMTEIAATRRLFEWAQKGDLLICPVHIQKNEVLSLMTLLSSQGWKAGEPLPQEG